MTKWVALALGALLALGGAIAIWNGIYYIPSEFGGAYVIAGSAAMAGGVVTFALFLLIREVQALRAGAGTAEPISAPPLEPSAPEPLEAPAPSAPVFPTRPVAPQAPFAAKAPEAPQAPAEPRASFSASSPPLASPPPPASAPEAPPSPPRFEPLRRSPLPHETPDFAQVFPPVPGDSAPSPLRSFESATRAARFRMQASEVAPVAAVGGLAATAALIGMANRPRVGQPPEATPQEPSAEEPKLQEQRPEPVAEASSPEPAPAAEAAPFFEPEPEPVTHHAPEPELEHELEPEIEADPEQEPEDEPTLALAHVAEHREEPLEDAHEPYDEAEDIAEEARADQQAHEEASADLRDEEPQGDERANGSGGSDEQPLSPGYAWLERALARDEGRKSPALEWLRSRQPTGLTVEPPSYGQNALQQDQSYQDCLQQEPLDEREPAHRSEHEAEPEPVHEATSAEEPSSAQAQESAAPEAHVEEEPAPAAEPDVVGRYSSGGSHYTLYADGTIDAQSDQGIFRFASMAELRAHIEAQNQQPQ